MNGAHTAPAKAHVVDFYDDEIECTALVAAYVAEGLSLGERVLVIATEERREALAAALRGSGVDAARAEANGSYHVLDAARTLEELAVDDTADHAVDHARLAAWVATYVSRARADGVALRTYGEMVTLLWERGQRSAAIELEAAWNELSRDRFSLLCAYPASALDSADLHEVGRLCELHTSVLPPVSYAPVAPPVEAPAAEDAVPPGLVEPEQPEDDYVSGVVSGVFVPVPSAVAAARRFVTAVLRSWGLDDLVWDAALVTSELATNAVGHGDSPFRASVVRTEGMVRVGIEDIGPGWPQERASTHDLSDGRGVAIVAALAQRTGCDVLPVSKLAWAEFTPHAS